MESELCIVRRVEEEYRALNPPEDDGESLFRQVLGRLKPEELAEWRRQILEIEKLYPPLRHVHGLRGRLRARAPRGRVSVFRVSE